MMQHLLGWKWRTRPFRQRASRVRQIKILSVRTCLFYCGPVLPKLLISIAGADGKYGLFGLPKMVSDARANLDVPAVSGGFSPRPFEANYSGEFLIVSEIS
jgi:hypothetical protein